MTEYGSISGGLKQKTTYEFIDGVSTRTDEITCDWSDRNSLTPEIGDGAPGESAMKLIRAVQERVPGDLCKLTLIYQTPDTDEETGVPATTYVENSCTMEVAIQAHPDFDDWSADWDEEKQAFKPGTSKYGQTSYLVGSTTVTVTSFYTSKPAAAYTDIGTIETPGGGYSGTNKWLLVGANRGRSGAFWTLSKEYLYSAKGWDTEVYG